MKLFYQLHPYIVRFLEPKPESTAIPSDISPEALKRVVKLLDLPEFLADEIYPLFEKNRNKSLLSENEQNPFEQLRLQLSQYIAHQKKINTKTCDYQQIIKPVLDEINRILTVNNRKHQNVSREDDDALIAKYDEIENRFSKEGNKRLLKEVMRTKFQCIIQEIELCTLDFADDGELIPNKLSSLMDMYDGYDEKCIDIIKNFKPKRYQDNSPLENQKIYTKEYAFFEAEYKKLLTYCRMAHFFEGNGSPFYHALKLAVVFPNAKSAMDEIYRYAQMRKGVDEARNPLTNVDSCFVHDFCLYDLPKVKPKYWKKWCSLLVSNRMDADIVKAFAFAGDIESLYENNHIESFSEDISLLDMKENEFLDKIAKIRKEILSAKRNTENTEEVIGLVCALNLTLKSYAIHQKRQNTNFENLSKETIKGLFLFVQNKLNLTESIFNEFGVHANYVDYFNKLDKTRAGSNIPFIEKQMVKIENGKKEEHFYIQSLDIRNPSEAILAACLGKMTNCCQFLGGYGSDCTEHGLTSPEGGFYICYQLDKSKPFGLHILAQSWVWRGQKDELVFDSIEYQKYKISSETVSQLFNAILLKIILRKFSNNIRPISSIHCGASGQTPEEFAHPLNYIFFGSNELDAFPKDYKGYRDSKRQVTLYHPQMPHIQVSRLNDYIIEEKNEIFKRIRDVILFDAKQSSDIKDSQIIKNMAEYFCLNLASAPEFLANLKLIFQLEDSTEFQSIYNWIEKCLMSNLELKSMIDSFTTADFDKDPIQYSDKVCELIENGAHLYLREKVYDYNGCLFSKIINHPHLIIKILKNVNAKERLKAFNNLNILKVLILAPGCVESLFDILDDFLRNYLKKAVGSSGVCYLLYTALESLPIFKTVYSLYDKEEAFKKICGHSQSGDVQSVLLNRIIMCDDTLAFILDQFGSRNSIVFIHNIFENSNLSLLSFESCQLLLSYFDDNEKKILITKPNAKGNTLLRSFCNNHLFIKLLLSYIQPHLRERYILEKDHEGKNYLHYAAVSDSVDPLKELLWNIDRKNWVTDLNQCDNYGRTTIFEAAFRVENFEYILSIYSRNERQSLLNVRDSSHNTIIHKVRNLDCLIVILSKFPVEERFILMMDDPIEPTLVKIITFHGLNMEIRYNLLKCIATDSRYFSERELRDIFEKIREQYFGCDSELLIFSSDLFKKFDEYRINEQIRVQDQDRIIKADQSNSSIIFSQHSHVKTDNECIQLPRRGPGL